VSFYLFIYLFKNIEILVTFSKKLTKLVEFTIGKNLFFHLICFVETQPSKQKRILAMKFFQGIGIWEVLDNPSYECP
jgi:hypothetical protein